MKLKDIDGVRTLRIDGRNAANPASVFIMGERGYCIEVNRTHFLELLSIEFGLTNARSDKAPIAA